VSTNCSFPDTEGRLFSGLPVKATTVYDAFLYHFV